MRLQRIAWQEPAATAEAVRRWTSGAQPDVDVSAIGREVREGGDAAVMRLTERFDATERAPASLRVAAAECEDALAGLDPRLRAALETAAANIRAVAEAQPPADPREVKLPQGHVVLLREVPVGSAGLYAPGGRASYPSTVLMGAIPARVAGVGRIALASPPGPDGTLDATVLAAAALCAVDEVYAMGGAQAIFALADGTESVASVDLIAGPGNAWVQEAKRAVFGRVGIDSVAGPSELMVIAGHDTDAEWAALDLCAQAEHGPEGPLVVAAVEEAVLDSLAQACERRAAESPSVADAPLALVQVPDLEAAVELANALAPEHVELLSEDATKLSARLTTPGCVFAGRHGATAFGDYAAGSNHVLPTGGAGRFAGPLGPGTFRRRISEVRVDAASAAALAPHVTTLAEAEGFPVHGASAAARG